MTKPITWEDRVREIVNDFESFEGCPFNFFWACEGHKTPPKYMITCFACRNLYKMREAIRKTDKGV